MKSELSQLDVTRLYDRLAPVYDGWGKLAESRARKRVLELAEIRNGQSILEVAAGTGLAFQHVVRENPDGRNVAIDISEGMLDRARRRLRRAGIANYEARMGTAFDIGEPDASFDTVLNSYMFDLLDEREWPRAIGEFYRVLKAGGRLAMANMTHGEKPGSGLYERLYRISPSLMGGCRGVRLSGPLGECGFTVQSREYVQQCLFPSEVIIATKPA